MLNHYYILKWELLQSPPVHFGKNLHGIFFNFHIVSWGINCLKELIFLLYVLERDCPHGHFPNCLVCWWVDPLFSPDIYLCTSICPNLLLFETLSGGSTIQVCIGWLQFNLFPVSAVACNGLNSSLAAPSSIAVWYPEAAYECIRILEMEHFPQLFVEGQGKWNYYFLSHLRDNCWCDESLQSHFKIFFFG